MGPLALRARPAGTGAERAWHYRDGKVLAVITASQVTRYEMDCP
ncbi:hypothetical protein ACWF99_17930 [Nocardia sp. NPDC055002]